MPSEATDEETQTTDQPVTLTPAPPTPTPPAQDKPKDDDKDGDESTLPEWAQKALKTARGDAGKARNNAKQQAAEAAKQEMAQQIGKALGLIKDDEKVDPAKLAQDLRDLQVEQAAYRSAPRHGVDPDALIDSKSAARHFADLDPSAKDFSSQVEAAIKEAVKADPRLKAASQVPGRNATELPGGSGENKKTKATNLAEAVANRYRK